MIYRVHTRTQKYFERMCITPNPAKPRGMVRSARTVHAEEDMHRPLYVYASFVMAEGSASLVYC